MKTTALKSLTIVLLALSTAYLIPRAHAASAAWNVDGNATWSANASWSPAAAPGSTSADNADIATFNLPLTANSTVTVDSGRFIGGISFGNNSTRGYTLSNGSINLNNGGVIQTLSTDGIHTNTINSSIKINGGDASTATFTAGAGNATANNLNIGAVTGSATTISGLTTLTLNGNRTSTGVTMPTLDSITGIIGNGVAGGKLAVVKDGTGLWALGGANTFSGGLTIKAGTLVLGTSSTSGGAGAIYLGDTAATGANATLVLYNSSGGMGIPVNPLTVQAGSNGTKTIRNNSNSATPQYNGTITMNDNLTASGGTNGGLIFGTPATINLNANTLTLNGGTLTFNGVISGSGNVTQAAAGNSTLNAANTFTGVTKVSAGNLILGNSLALQNSSLDTLNSIAGNATAGLKTTVTALTLGGLTGNKNLATVFTSSSGGYGNLTALTLNPGTGVTNSYSGNIINGAAGMTLTKTGNGTQVLSGNNTYTGATTITGGTLQATAANALGSTSTVAINNGSTLLVSAQDAIGATTGIDLNGGTMAFGAAGYNGTLGALTLNANSVLDLGSSSNGTLIRFASINWSGTSALSIYNWNGTSQLDGGDGNNPDQIFFTSTILSETELQRISFFSDMGSTFIGNAFQFTSGTFNREIIPVPEPSSCLTLALFLVGYFTFTKLKQAKKISSKRLFLY